MRLKASLLALFCLVGSASAQENREARLLRFPTIHGDQLVFTYGGNLYTVKSTGGTARRLTSHDGFEMFPHFSPDGKWIAFTAQYDGNTEIYIIPAEGGAPKRLTFTATLGRDDISDRMGPNNICMGWKHDGKHIVFRSRMRSFNSFLGSLFLVPLEGGLPEELPLPRGGFCSFSPDDLKLAYNRIFREFRTWKRYRGGMADDISIYDFKTKKTTAITNDPAQDIIPMWYQNRIYFASDRDKNKRMNLFVYDLDSKETRQLTEFTDFDIKFPTLGDKAIVFEKGGWIYRFDLATEKAVKVPVRILEDYASARNGLREVGKEVTNYEIAPDGNRALFGARGEIFTVPAKNGPTRNLTNTPGVHERNSKWSPNGKWIAYVSDKTGEDEIWMMDPRGNDAKQLTQGGDTYKYEIYWSPDSKKILWTDKKLRLSYLDVETKKVTLVNQAPVWEIRDAVWSPDSKWMAWSQNEKQGLDRVYIYSLEQNKAFSVTQGWYGSNTPCFSGDGKFLFFASARDFNPIFNSVEWNHAYRDMERIYLVPLAKETESPFLPQSDEVEVKEDKPDKKKEDDKKDDKDKDMKVDVNGLSDRILRLPIATGSYSNIQSVGGTVYYIHRSSKATKSAFKKYDLKAKKETALGSIGGYEIAANGKKILVSQSGKYGILDLPNGPVTVSSPLDLSGMEMYLDRQAEWKQMFHESWRQMRDFFYDPNMHGVDWKAMRDRYEPLVEHVSHRADLTYVIGEMVSELNVGHAYVGDGDRPLPARVPTGLLGAELSRDGTGYYKIDKILKGVHWDPKLRSPLSEPGVNVKEGEYIVAVGGRSTKDMTNIYEALLNTSGKQITLKINDKPQEEGARSVVVRPIADESALYYYAWVQDNIDKVNKATDGKVGYLHIPDMVSSGLNEFVKHFYPQVHKKGLIIDVRGNGGGNVSPQIIERLRREAAMITIARNSAPFTNPGELVWGPKVCLMNEFSASDGDIFAYRFKIHKLGKTIGRRSWGGVVGIRGSLPLLDGGTLRRPEFSRYDLEGKEWVIEGYGVDPDIVIDNDPAREYAGVDDQLNKGIEVILEELKTKEKTIPVPPPTPKR